MLTRAVILLHDDARLHTALLTLETVEQLALEVLPHPPYIRTWLPVTILFQPMKKMLGGLKFASDTEVQSVIRQRLGQQPASFFASGIQKLVNRWNKCLNKLGQYVEK